MKRYSLRHLIKKIYFYGVHAHQEFFVVFGIFQTAFLQNPLLIDSYRQIFAENPHTVQSSLVEQPKSSRRVLDATMFTAGKIRLLLKLRSAGVPCYLYSFEFFGRLSSILETECNPVRLR